MNCKYCQQEITFVKGSKYQCYRCASCQVAYEYETIDNDLLLHKELWRGIYIGEREFSAHVFPINHIIWIGRVTKGRNMAALSHSFTLIDPEETHEWVFDLKFIPENWNPQTITKKIQLLLPFI